MRIIYRSGGSASAHRPPLMTGICCRTRASAATPGQEALPSSAMDSDAAMDPMDCRKPRIDRAESLISAYPGLGMRCCLTPEWVNSPGRTCLRSKVSSDLPPGSRLSVGPLPPNTQRLESGRRADTYPRNLEGHSSYGRRMVANGR